MAPWPGFIGGAGVSQSLVGDAEDSINFSIETLKNGKKALFSTPGFSPWTPLSTVADVGSRATCVANGRLFWVVGGNLYEFDVNGTPTKRGTVGVDGNPAQIIFNGITGNQLGIVSAGSVFSYNLATNVLSAALLVGGYTHLAFALGFGIALNPTLGQANVSKANDLSVWNAGTFFKRSLFADPYQAMWVDANNLIWLIGTDTFEVRFAGNPTADQPFTPLSGLTGAYGIVAPFAFASSLLTGSANFWLAKNPSGIGEFVATTSNYPQSVSEYPFNTAIGNYLRTSSITDAEVVTYQADGHQFVNTAFPSAQAAMPTDATTWTFDAKVSSWGKRGRWDGVKGKWGLWSPRVHAFAFGKHLIGDRATGIIYQMDATIATEIDGSGIVCERTAPNATDELKREPINNIQLLMDTGVGTATGQGADPQALLRLSADGGRTYGNELRCGYGPIGRFRQRVMWTRLGAPEHAVIKIRFADPTPKRIIDAFVNNLERIAA